MAVAVFPKDFPAVAQQMASGLVLSMRNGLRHRWTSFSALTLLTPARPLRAAVGSDAAGPRPWAEAHVGIVESMVIRMVAEAPAEELARDPLLVWTNGFAEFPVEREAFKAPSPRTRPASGRRHARRRDAQALHLQHVSRCTGLSGHFHGYETVVDCLADPAVLDAKGALASPAGVAGRIRLARRRDGAVDRRRGRQTDNPALGDTVARYGATRAASCGAATASPGPCCWRAATTFPRRT